MKSIRFVHWQDGKYWLGFLEDFPEYWTQGESFDDLMDHLMALHAELADGTY